MKKKDEWPPAKNCTHPKSARYFSEDGLLEWCGNCGELIMDHHLRKWGYPHPQL